MAALMMHSVGCGLSAGFAPQRLRIRLERIAAGSKLQLHFAIRQRRKAPLVPLVRIERTLPCGNGILNPARLPVPPQGPINSVVSESAQYSQTCCHVNGGATHCKRCLTNRRSHLVTEPARHVSLRSKFATRRAEIGCQYQREHTKTLGVARRLRI